MGQEPPYSPYDIRVAIVQQQPRVTVTVRGDYRIVALHTTVLLRQGSSLSRVPISTTATGLQLGNASLPADGIRIEPVHGAAIDVDDRRVRGVVEISRQHDGTLLVVNRLSLDAYLFGVLYHETLQLWPMETLKAQAIVSRTYALYHSQHVRQGTAKDFDVTATVYSQVYGGRSSERWRTSRAVRETAGLVLTYNGALFPAYFHATCGGSTESAAQLWNVDVPSLKGVLCPWCLTTPHYHWTREIMQRDLGDTLRAHGATIQRITAVTVAERTPSGRAVRLRVEGPGGPTEVAANDLREWLGHNWLKSVLFDVHLGGYKVIFDGRGWGHGVGMCQWGAAEQARRGRTAEEILRFYFPGAVIQPWPAGRPQQGG